MHRQAQIQGLVQALIDGGKVDVEAVEGGRLGQCDTPWLGALSLVAGYFTKERTCYTCFWLKQSCRCPLITPFATDMRFVILMHTKEAKQAKLGTGRITHATLINSEIIVGVDFTHTKAVNDL